MSYYNLTKLAEEQVNNELPHRPSVASAAGTGAGLAVGAGLARIGRDLYKRGVSDKNVAFHSIKINEDKIPETEKEIEYFTDQYSQRRKRFLDRLHKTHDEYEEAVRNNNKHHMSVYQDSLSEQRKLLMDLKRSHEHSVKFREQLIDEMTKENIKYKRIAETAHSPKAYWQRLTEKGPFDWDSYDYPSKYKKSIAKSAIVGAGAGLLYRHFKNKNKDN